MARPIAQQNAALAAVGKKNRVCGEKSPVGRRDNSRLADAEMTALGSSNGHREILISVLIDDMHSQNHLTSFLPRKCGKQTNMTVHPEEQKSWVETVDNVATINEKKDASTNGFVEGTDEEKKLVRKIDLFLMPTIWVLYCFSYMDRTNIGNAKVAGMDKDIGLSSTQYFLAIVVFQVGYVIAEIPSK